MSLVWSLNPLDNRSRISHFLTFSDVSKVFVHPLCGKGNGRQIWESVAPIFARANVKTTVSVCYYESL